jgi:hypothetical protein
MKILSRREIELITAISFRQGVLFMLGASLGEPNFSEKLEAALKEVKKDILSGIGVLK